MKVINNVLLFFFESKFQGLLIESVNIIMHVFCMGGSKFENMYCNLQLSVGGISVINWGDVGHN